MNIQRIDDVQNKEVRGTKFATVNNLPSKTNREDLEKADIRHIKKRFLVRGEIENKSDVQPVTGQDLSNLPDLRTALDNVINAREKFMKLPRDARERFGNDPFQMLEFLSKKENQAEAVNLGLAIPVLSDQDREDHENGLITKLAGILTEKMKKIEGAG